MITNAPHFERDGTRRPILLTGAHRSGTTWVGKVLSASRELGMIYEPFHTRWCRPGVCRARWPWPFPYICDRNADSIREAVRDMLQFRYQVWPELKAVERPWDVARMLRDYSRFTYHRVAGHRPLVKDPIALFSAPWLESEFNVQVVILVRHPVAFAASLKRRNWRFDFRHFLQQTHLMEDILYPYEREINELVANPSVDIVRQAAALWRILYSTVLTFREKHPTWIVVRHEDLVRSPYERFEALCDALLISDVNNVLKRIESYNVFDRKSATSTRVHRLKRTGDSVLSEWKNYMTPDEVAIVRASVDSIASEYYCDVDWPS